MRINNKGQGLLESLMILPFSILLIGSLLWGSYFYFSNFLIDHWLYQACLCVQKEVPVATCKQKLNKELSKLPLLKFSNVKVWSNYKDIVAKLTFNHPLSNSIDRKVIQSKNLQSQDFEKAL